MRNVRFRLLVLLLVTGCLLTAASVGVHPPAQHDRVMLAEDDDDDYDTWMDWWLEWRDDMDAMC